MTGIVERLIDQVAGLLQCRGSVYNELIVAVAAALDRLEIVALGRLDPAQSRAGAHDIDDYAGHVAGRNVGDSLLLEADSGAGGAGHGAASGSGGAVHHIDSGHLALRLDEHAAHLGLTLAHVLGNFVLGRDRIAEEPAAARANGGFRNGLVALH